MNESSGTQPPWAGRMLPFFEAFVLIDVLIHRCHGEYEGDGNLRQGASNLIGGRPAEIIDMLDRIGGVRRRDLSEPAHHADWVDKVRQERPGVLDPLRKPASTPRRQRRSS